MKKFLACLTVFSLISSSATAQPFHFHHDFHRPAPVIIHKNIIFIREFLFWLRHRQVLSALHSAPEAQSKHRLFIPFR